MNDPNIYGNYDSGAHSDISALAERIKTIEDALNITQVDELRKQIGIKSQMFTAMDPPSVFQAKQGVLFEGGKLDLFWNEDKSLWTINFTDKEFNNHQMDIREDIDYWWRFNSTLFLGDMLNQEVL